MGRVSDLDLAQLSIVRLRMSWNFLGEEKFIVPLSSASVGAHDARYRHRNQLPCFLAWCCALTFPIEATALFGLDRTTTGILCRSSMGAASFGMNLFFFLLSFFF